MDTDRKRLCEWLRENATSGLMDEAADLIERLSAKVEAVEARAGRLSKFIQTADLVENMAIRTVYLMEMQEGFAEAVAAAKAARDAVNANDDLCRGKEPS